jgi:hypothetical protein
MLFGSMFEGEIISEVESAESNDTMEMILIKENSIYQDETAICGKTLLKKISTYYSSQLHFVPQEHNGHPLSKTAPFDSTARARQLRCSDL